MTKEEAVALMYFESLSLGSWTIFALTKYLQIFGGD